MSTAIMEISHDDVVVIEDNNTEESQDEQEVSQQLKREETFMEKLEKIRLHRHRIQQRPRSSSWPRWLQGLLSFFLFLFFFFKF